ncbi:hypothetical protein [Acidithiobacillus thiooxidans]|jgi:hypothetical protein|uniref:hypothetical protein n=1 Tax=Acidithiobacillus thiooxidans TaxID=930 RepID=UPI001C06DC3F|nr:hypothetical protein [Acidithiobacillus thiooxidans]MBU2843785.1 hypothetical protein [Acidithiobacillus thiooxidans]
MKEQAKFYVFAGVFGVGILGLLVGIYFWDFAPQTPKPAGDGFVSVPSHPINSLPRLVTRMAPEGRLASVPGRLPVPQKPEPVTIRTPTRSLPRSEITPAKPKPVALKKMHQTVLKLRQEVRTLMAEQTRMDQQLQHLQAVQQARTMSRSTSPTSTAPVKNLPGWSVESIGVGQAWIEGPSGNTHVVQAGATLDGFRILAISPDQVLTSRGRIIF